MSETIIRKTCRVCKETKPISEFNKHKSTKDGHQHNCRMCSKKYDKEYRQTKKGKATHHKADLRYQQTDKFKTCQKRYLQSEKGRVAQRIGQKRFNARHPNQIKARSAVKNAIKVGKLPRPNILQCHYGEHPAEKYHHHLGYAPKHWLDVIPVCSKCHSICHKKLA